MSELYGVPMWPGTCPTHELKAKLTKAILELEEWEKRTGRKHSELERIRPIEKLITVENVIITETVDGWVRSKFNGLKSQCGLIHFDNWSYLRDWVKVLDEHLEKCFQVAKLLHYSRACITQAYDPMVEPYTNRGWKIVDTFLNHRSGNEVRILMKEVPHG